MKSIPKMKYDLYYNRWFKRRFGVGPYGYRGYVTGLLIQAEDGSIEKS